MSLSNRRSELENDFLLEYIFTDELMNKCKETMDNVDFGHGISVELADDLFIIDLDVDDGEEYDDFPDPSYQAGDPITPEIIDYFLKEVLDGEDNNVLFEMGYGAEVYVLSSESGQQVKFLVEVLDQGLIEVCDGPFLEGEKMFPPIEDGKIYLKENEDEIYYIVN